MSLFVRSLEGTEVERQMMTNGLILRTLQPESEQPDSPETLIIALFVAADGPERAERFARHWQPMVPRAQFLGVEFEDMLWNVNQAALQRIMVEAVAARGLTPGQMLLLGLGEAGRFAMELVLHGVLPAAGVMAYDMPLMGAKMLPPRSAAAFRFVQQTSPDDPGNIQFRSLVRKLQRQDIDVRAIILPEDSLWNHDMPMRAGTSFLVELVAKAAAKPR